MENLLNVIQSILGLGAVVILPIMICALGLFFRMEFGAALKAGLLVGIGFSGLGLVIGLLMTSINPVVEYYQAFGSGFTVADLGWAAVGAASWTVPFAAISVPLIIFTNIIFLKLKLTKVMNVDIWNYIHFLVPGAMAYALWDSFVIGLALTVALSMVVLFLGQKAARNWADYFGLEGTTCSTLSFIAWVWPIAVLFNKIIDKIPVVNKIEINMTKLGDKLGMFGDPAVVGMLVGAFLGIITKQNYKIVFTMAIGVSAVLILIPRMVGFMMEGLSAIGTATNAYMKKFLNDESNELHIGMDIALGLGDPGCITVTMLTIPCVILMAFILPGLNYFPIGLLTGVCYTSPFMVMCSKGNLFRSFVCMVVFYAMTMMLANWFTPEATAMMRATGVEVTGMVTDGMFGLDPGCIAVGLINKIL
ncbi:MAG: PTS galactitol transporter subunit IIC [Synergistaceae bacterium]|jgi:PTS system galactitol-specific IIC component|nr:PTS galactitol transporter subunit IIC [Synergistaceae bacterium]